jgi:hypothetical protein
MSNKLCGKIKAITLIVDCVRKKARVLVDFGDDKEYILFNNFGETINHWINIETLNFNKIKSVKKP